MWQVAISDIPAGRKYRIVEDGRELTFRRFLELLQSNAQFADWFSDTLAAFERVAFYWELPPLTKTTIDAAAEFVLVDATSLARLPPEPAPFASYFEKRPDEDVVVFPNLGGDAILVVPCPHGPAETYAHLAAFLRQAEKEQIRALWRLTATTLLQRLDDKPTWLSTAGGGVAWLHIRLDTRPKYYSHRPYAVTA